MRKKSRTFIKCVCVPLALSSLLAANSCSPGRSGAETTGDLGGSGAAETAPGNMDETEENLPIIGEAQRLPQGEIPLFKDVSVHDPSVTKVGDFYYIIGSHMQAAKSRDLIMWASVSTGPDNTPLFEGKLKDELKPAVQWANNELYWAADWIQLRADGKFYMYYCVSKGDSPQSCIGIAVADDIEGPYKDTGIIIKSPDGAYDASRMPNAVDPQVFYDKDGRMWLVYGSYSGGIFILELDQNTGKPKPGQSYGTKLTGGLHTPIEGAYIIYSPETDYYYLFTSFGGLSYNDGYNMRVSRSKSPTGPYTDYEGQAMIGAASGSTTAFDTSKIQNFGLKLFGNHIWRKAEGDTGKGRQGYVSSGHNSAYYDAETGRYFLIFHTRFPGEGEVHEVRVHQMFMNEDGWPVVAPCRYSGETIGNYTGENIIGDYKFINHGHEITKNIVKSSEITLRPDYTVVRDGETVGEWRLRDGHMAELTVDGVTYKGVFLFQYDPVTGAYTMTFSASSRGGATIWGIQIYER